ncbi:hypothetical protein C8T65DRAFT_731918 [Cerioporus squamosus]|nr:hypothetical protein C8T65DRAFT_731918 [Cerioporus squamosus]
MWGPPLLLRRLCLRLLLQLIPSPIMRYRPSRRIDFLVDCSGSRKLRWVARIDRAPDRDADPSTNSNSNTNTHVSTAADSAAVIPSRPMRDRLRPRPDRTATTAVVHFELRSRRPLSLPPPTHPCYSLIYTPSDRPVGGLVIASRTPAHALPDTSAPAPEHQRTHSRTPAHPLPDTSALTPGHQRTHSRTPAHPLPDTSAHIRPLPADKPR